MSDNRARYIMIGGFLGAGKTTALAALAKRLTASGQRVGLITNDQSRDLVDTSILRSHGFAVEEISGGCFCCRFNSLSEAAERLTAVTKPEVFIAEPVGSCTDLLATVSYPLRRIHGDRFVIAPLSVMVDPARARRILGLAEGRSFSEKVIYVYEKQLEEAALIVVNKCDQHEAEEIEELSLRLGERFPQAEVLTVSAKNEQGLDAWFDRILSEEDDPAPTMNVDYQLYAEGEALLGWLNMTASLRGETMFNANELLVQLSQRVLAELDGRGLEIAHFKLTLDSPEAGGQLAALSMTTNESGADLREALLDGIHTGELILNLRAEADPDLLLQVCLAALDQVQSATMGLSIKVQHEEHFRPSPPVPTHRVELTATGELS
ncbi:MAG: G3E family GTPase [Candidatus Paceibacteria bacterium]|jgi:G3E family GTPase